MLKVTIVLFLTFSLKIGFSQDIVKVSSLKGKIDIHYSNSKIVNLNLNGFNEVVDYSLKNKIIVFTRLEYKTKIEEEGICNEQHSLNIYNLISNKEEKLFTTKCYAIGCKNGTTPSYANTTLFPFDGIVCLSNVILNHDGSRIYFESEAWSTSSSIHYYDLKLKKLVFFKAGSLIKVNKSNIEVESSDIDFVVENNNIESNGRSWQNCLYDLEGKLIAKLPSSTDTNEIKVQNSSEILDKREEDAVLWASVKPIFNKGNFKDFCNSNIEYSKKAITEGVEGRVIIEFIIEKDGTVTNIKASKKLEETCDDEAIRLVQLTSGNWSAAKNNGKPVRLRIMEQIWFNTKNKDIKLKPEKKSFKYESILKTKEIKINVFNSNGNELSSGHFDSKEVDFFNLTFRLSENPIAEKCTKTFYAIMTLPNGNIYSDSRDGGGYFTTADYESLAYTSTQNLLFENKEEIITIRIKGKKPYEVGDYKFEVYCDGFKIGQKSILIN